MTTHHKDSAFMLADTLHFIENGQVLTSIASSKFFNAALPLRVAELLGITNVFTLKKIADKPKMYECAALQTNFELSTLPENGSDEFLLGVKPVDIRIIKEDEQHLQHTNRFCGRVEQIFYKENDALVFLKIPTTGFSIKIELSVYNLKKMNIQAGMNIQCKIKEEYSKILY